MWIVRVESFDIPSFLPKKNYITLFVFENDSDCFSNNIFLSLKRYIFYFKKIIFDISV